MVAINELFPNLSWARSLYGHTVPRVGRDTQEGQLCSLLIRPSLRSPSGGPSPTVRSLEFLQEMDFFVSSLLLVFTITLFLCFKDTDEG